MHCDTISELYYRKRDGKPYSLRENELHVDLKKLVKGGWGLQCFAAFTNLAREKEPYAYCNTLIDLYYEELNKNSDLIAPVLKYSDIEKNRKAGKLSALLTVEEGQACEGDAEKLRALYDRGVRLMNITWNYPNSLGFPSRVDMKTGVFEAETERGLTEKGFEIVEEMVSLGMVVDVSHSFDKSFADIAATVKGPFVASHSNCRAVCNHPRNLTDDMIKTLAEHGGVAGINYCAEFVKYGVRGCAVSDLIEHIKHYIKIGGEDCVGLGSDFDGIDPFGLEIHDASYEQLLYEALLKSGIGEKTAEKIFYQNVDRVFSEILR